MRGIVARARSPRAAGIERDLAPLERGEALGARRFLDDALGAVRAREDHRDGTVPEDCRAGSGARSAGAVAR